MLARIRRGRKLRIPQAASIRFMREEAGDALVELAVAVLLCTTLILGSAELGRYAYASIEISNAAHAGASYGSQSHTSAADTSGMQTVATDEAANISDMSATATRFCLCADGTASTCAVTDCSTSRIVEYVKVSTSAKVDPKIYIPGLPRSYTIQGLAIMRVVQ